MSTDLALGVGEGCPLFGGVYTLCGVVEEDIHYPGEFVPTVRLRFMGECGTGYALCWEVNAIRGVDTWGGCGGGGLRIHLSYRWVVVEVIHSVKEVIQLI